MTSLSKSTFTSPNSLTLNVHDLSTYTSQALHVAAPFFLVHRLGDHDPSTDSHPHDVALCTLHSALLALKNSVSTAGHVNNDFHFPPIPRRTQFAQHSLLASKSTQYRSPDQPL